MYSRDRDEQRMVNAGFTRKAAAAVADRRVPLRDITGHSAIHSNQLRRSIGDQTPFAMDQARNTINAMSAIANRSIDHSITSRPKSRSPLALSARRNMS